MFENCWGVLYCFSWILVPRPKAWTSGYGNLSIAFKISWDSYIYYPVFSSFKWPKKFLQCSVKKKEINTFKSLIFSKKGKFENFLKIPTSLLILSTAIGHFFIICVPPWLRGPCCRNGVMHKRWNYSSRPSKWTQNEGSRWKFHLCRVSWKFGNKKVTCRKAIWKLCFHVRV